MPLFEYTCSACGHSFEKLQRDNTAQSPECPSCGSSEVKREIAGFASIGNPQATADCAPGG